VRKEEDKQEKEEKEKWSQAGLCDQEGYILSLSPYIFCTRFTPPHSSAWSSAFQESTGLTSIQDKKHWNNLNLPE
jgi:hypothetical protein